MMEGSCGGVSMIQCAGLADVGTEYACLEEHVLHMLNMLKIIRIQSR